MDSNAPEYGITRDLKGFQHSTLRVRITRREAGLVWVRTADLTDAGTSLVLDASQVSPETKPLVDCDHDSDVREWNGLCYSFRCLDCGSCR